MRAYPARTHYAGMLSPSLIGTSVSLNGWVASRRDLGGLIFIDLRDHTGIAQVVFSPQHVAELMERAGELRSEYVVAVSGEVRRRERPNPLLPTGEVEIYCTELVILNRADTPPFEIGRRDQVGEELRLKYRYLDLRDPDMQRIIRLRSQVYQVTHQYFSENGFVEIETPMLVRSTPEGARDYLVPSRVHPGKFYALPQSPQIYKQLLMVAGYDRYMQIAKCMRDEDLRADRQPEFTQLDLEMAFAEQEEVFATMEPVLHGLFEEFSQTQRGTGAGAQDLAVLAQDVADLVRVRYGGDRAVDDRQAGELSGRQERAFDVDVGVDETRQQVRLAGALVALFVDLVNTPLFNG